MAGACKRTFSLPDVMSMLDLDDTQSGSDSNIKDLNDEPDVSDSDNKDVAMEEPPKTPMNEQPEANMDEPPERTPSYEPYEPPMEEHTITKGPMSKKRRPAMPTTREWVEILDRKNDKSSTLLEFKEIVGATKYMAEDATAVDYFDLFFSVDDGRQHPRVVCSQGQNDWYKGSRIGTWCSQCGANYVL